MRKSRFLQKKSVPAVAFVGTSTGFSHAAAPNEKYSFEISEQKRSFVHLVIRGRCARSTPRVRSIFRREQAGRWAAYRCLSPDTLLRRSWSCKLGVGKDLGRVEGRRVNQERGYQRVNQGQGFMAGGRRKINKDNYLRTCTVIVMYQNGRFFDNMNQF
jgi:hypothetical protein